MSTTISDKSVGLEAANVVPSLGANFKWTFAGNFVYATCQWGMLSILAKAGGQPVVGQFALGLAVSAPVFMFTNLQLRAVQATDTRSEFEFADYFTLRILASLIGLITVAVAAWFLRYDSGTQLVILLIAVSKAIESLGDAVAGLLQKVERIHQVAISLMLRGGLSLAAFGATFLYLHSLVASVIALVISWSVVFLAYDLSRAAAIIKPGAHFCRFRPATLCRLLVLGAPLGAVMTLFSLNANIPRYLLAKFQGDAKLGIFASMAYMLVALYLIVNALGDSATARMARIFAQGDLRTFSRILKNLLLIGCAILVFGPLLAAFFGRTLLAVLYRPEYSVNLDAFILMMVSGGLTAIGYFLGYGITAARRFRSQVPVIALSTFTTAVLSFVLIPRLGLIGAALALVATAFVHVVGNTLVLRHALSRIPPVSSRGLAGSGSVPDTDRNLPEKTL